MLHFCLTKLVSVSLCSQYVSQQVSKLHLELEEKQSVSSLQQLLEREEQKKTAENMRRFNSASFGNNTNNTNQYKNTEPEKIL